MKRILCLLFTACVAMTMCAQTQQGYVKTKGRLGNNGTKIPGIRLSGATVMVKGRNAVVSGSNGAFTLTIPGNSYYLQNVQKQGYILTDPEVLEKQYAYSKNPLILVLEEKSQLEAERRSIERKIRNKLYAQLQNREEEIESLKNQNKITEEKYRELLQKLNDDQDANERIVKDMSERYATIDFDQIDDFNRRISDCIINGRLMEADSLLNTKGDIAIRAAILRQHQEANAQAELDLKKRQKTLEKSKALTQKELDDLAKDCYTKYEIYKMRHMTDSAAYYIEYRASLDSTNIGWQFDVGNYYCYYLADYPKSLTLYHKILESVIHSEGEKSQSVITLYNHLAFIHHEQAKFDLSIANYKHLIEIARELYGENCHFVVSGMINLGLVYSSIDKNDEALNYYNQSLANKACTLTDSIRCYINIAGLYLDKFENETALQYYNKAATLNSNPQNDGDYLYLASCYNGLSVAYSQMDDYTKCFEYSNKALDINVRLYGESHPLVADSYSNQGAFYNKLSKYNDAITQFSKALSIDSIIYGQWHPRTAVDYNNIGYSYNNLGQYEKALDCYNKALKIDENYYGHYHSNIGTVLINIGSIYENQEDYTHALECNFEALKVLKEVWGEGHNKVANCYNNIGNIYTETHDYQKAEEYLKKSLEMDLSLYGENHSFTATSYNNLARMYNEKGDIDNAAKYMENVPTILSQIYGEEHVSVAIAYYNVSVLHKKRGDYEKALELAEKSYQILKTLLPDDHQTIKTVKDGIAEIQAKMKHVESPANRGTASRKGKITS